MVLGDLAIQGNVKALGAIAEIMELAYRNT